MFQSYEGTPLHWAAKFGRLELVRFLIELGLSLDHRSQRGNTALDLAIVRNRNEIAEVLIASGARGSSEL